MSNIDRARNSCGIGEYEGLGNKTASEVMLDVNKHMSNQDRAYLTFSCPIEQKTREGKSILDDLRDYIAMHKLGKCVEISPRKNPNSENVIGFLIWDWDKELFAEHVEKNKKEFVPKSGRKYKVINDTCGHRQEIGAIITRTKYFGDNAFNFEGSSCYITLNDVEEIK